jgi:hypothetical protein
MEKGQLFSDAKEEEKIRN